jgi:phosphate transport system substrate-binding protein
MTYLKAIACMVALACLPATAMGQEAAKKDPWEAMQAEVERLRQQPHVREVPELAKQERALDERIREVEERLSRTIPLQLASKWDELRDLQEKELDELERKAGERLAPRHAALRKQAPELLSQGRALGFDLLTFPRFEAHTQLHPLAVIVASRLLGVGYEWHHGERHLPRYYDGHAGWPEEHLLPMGHAAFERSRYYIDSTGPDAVGETETHRRIALMINHTLATASRFPPSYSRLIKGECDVLFIHRPPGAEELRPAQEQLIECVPIAREGLIFLVAQENPVRSITRERLRDSFLRKTRDWQELGGTPGAITPVLHVRRSATREVFDMVNPMGEVLIDTTQRQHYILGMSGVHGLLTGHSHAIGYSLFSFDYVMAMSPYTRALLVDGVEPTTETIASGTYPFTAPVYAAVRKSDPADAPGRRLAAWLVSAEGQAVVREAGLIPMAGR